MPASNNTRKYLDTLIPPELDKIEKILGFKVKIIEAPLCSSEPPKALRKSFYDAQLPLEGIAFRIESANPCSEHSLPSCIASWYMHGYPNCCGICITAACGIAGKYQRKGLNLILSRIKRILAKDMGYTLMLAAGKNFDYVGRGEQVPSRNLRTLTRVGYKTYTEFTNLRTTNKVYLCGFDLTKWNPDKDE